MLRPFALSLKTVVFVDIAGPPCVPTSAPHIILPHSPSHSPVCHPYCSAPFSRRLEASFNPREHPLGTMPNTLPRAASIRTTFCFDPNHILLRPESHPASTRITRWFGPNHTLVRSESHAGSVRITRWFGPKHDAARQTTPHRYSPFAARQGTFRTMKPMISAYQRHSFAVTCRRLRLIISKQPDLRTTASPLHFLFEGTTNFTVFTNAKNGAFRELGILSYPANYRRCVTLISAKESST